MTFSVQPVTLDAYATQVGRAGDDATATKNYINGFKLAENHGGLVMNWVFDSHIRSAVSSAGTIGKVAEILHASQGGLNKAASYYRSTDLLVAARFDSTIPGHCDTLPTSLEQEWAEKDCGPSFADTREPNSRLTPVGEVEFDHPLSWMDNLSISHWALKGFDHIFGFNPLDRVTETFLGDWQSVANTGVGIGRAAEALHDVGYNVQGGASALSTAWEGHAAAAAYDHFTLLADGIDHLVGPMREISKQFAEIAHAVWSTSEAVSGWIKGMIDGAIIAGIAYVAGTVTAESGVGAVVGYGVAAFEVANILRMWGQATKAVSDLYAVVQGSVGIIESLLTRIDHPKLPNMADYSAYQHPALVK